MQFVGAVHTRADLERFEDMTPGAVFRVIDEDGYVMWAAPGPDDDGEPPARAVDTPQWVDVPEGITSRALVDGYWPYVVGSDMVAAYPEVSHDLANKIAALNTNWTQFRDTRVWFSPWDGNATTDSGGIIVTPPGTAEGGLWLDAGKPASLWWFHNGGWRHLFSITWETYEEPNGPQIAAFNNGTRFRLSHSANLFYGTFIAKPSMLRDAAPLLVAAQADDQADDTAGGWDLAATVEQLAALVVQLQDRITELEARP